MSDELISLIVLILLSAFFSSSELAFVVANKIKIEIRTRKNNLAAKNALFFMKNPQFFYSTILVSNNIVNIAFASLITVFLTYAFGLNEIEILFISTAFLLIFGELLPKYIAREVADSFVLLSALPVRVVSFILYPLIKITAGVSSLFVNRGKLDKEEYVNAIDKDDIFHLVNESSEAGKVGEIESDIISKIIELSEQKVYEAMTPRTEIAGVEINSSIQEALRIFIESGYSKLPVYEDNLDNIKGLIFTKDMFTSPSDIKEIMRDVIFVPETKKSLEMLNEFLDKGISVAIIVDEFGGTEGLITIEDIIEELFGEIQDEYDTDENIFKQIDKYNYILSSKLEVDYLNDEYNLSIPEGDYETVGGYITSKLGKIPAKGEIFTADHFKVLILRSSRTKIELLKLTIDTEKLDI